MEMRRILMLSVIALLGWAASADANESFSYSGTTVGGPVFNRPGYVPPFVTGAIQARYHVQSFQANFGTQCVVDSVQNGQYDGGLHIYQGAFDPLAPLQNLIAAND